MSAEHPHEHEERLRAVVSGELDASAVTGCATCFARLEEFGELARLLDDDAETERRALEDICGKRDPRAEAHGAAFLRERFAGPAEHAPPSQRSIAAHSNPLPWIAAAALVIGLSVWIATRAPAPQRAIALGSASLECLEPQGPVAAYRDFSWRGTLPPGGWYEIDVYDAHDGARARIGAAHLEESRWSPTDEERSQLPATIRWTVRTMDATGTRGESCTSFASLPR